MGQAREGRRVQSTSLSTQSIATVHQKRDLSKQYVHAAVPVSLTSVRRLPACVDRPRQLRLAVSPEFVTASISDIAVAVLINRFTSVYVLVPPNSPADLGHHHRCRVSPARRRKPLRGPVLLSRDRDLLVQREKRQGRNRSSQAYIQQQKRTIFPSRRLAN